VEESNEQEEMCRYLWRNYRHALSERERALHLAATLELKARHASSEDSAKRLRQKPGYFFDDEVGVIAESGLAAFQQQCCARLLRDFPEAIHINRCEICQRIVASPIACACLWCGNQWYERRAEMVARATSSIYPAP
jgi:hypothetical protein